MILAFAATEANAADAKRVLLLHSFGRDFAPWSEISRAFHEELIKQSPEPIDFYEASLLEEEAWLIEYLKAFASDRKLDLVVTIGPSAARFVQSHRQELFADTPLLIAGVDERVIPAAMLTANDAVVGSQLDIAAWFENILRLLPETKEIAVVVGNSPIEQFWVSELRRVYEPFADRAKLTFLNNLPLDDIVQRVAHLGPQSVILYGIFLVDAAGVPQALDRALEPIRAAANVPVFGINDYQLGRGIVGGPLTPLQAHGRQAAGVGLRILEGETPNDIKIPPAVLGPLTYDWRELQRWGISEARLPPNSVVRFREPTAWEQYRWQIILIALALLVQASMIIALLVEHRRRRLAEQESRRHLLEVMHLNRISAAGEMSASIAHEINQPLAAIVASGNAGLRWLSRSTPDLEEVSASLKRIVSDGHRASKVIETVRTMFRKETAERALVDLNELVREALALSRDELKDHNISVNTVLTEGLPRVLADRTQLEQVILNLIRNAVEAMSSITSRARVLRIRSEANNSREVLLSIEDSGKGVDPKDVDRVFDSFFTTKSSGMGMGLSICRSIIEDHGGRLSVAAGRSQGAVFQIVVPVPA